MKLARVLKKSTYHLNTQKYNNYISNSKSTYDARMSSRNEIRLSTNFNIWNNNIGYNLYYTRDRSLAGTVSSYISNIIRATIKSFNISNTIDYNNIRTTNTSSDSTRGTLLVTKYVRDNKFNIRGSLNYEIRPTTKINGFTLSGNYNFNRNYVLRNSVACNFYGDNRLAYNASLTKKMDKFNLSLLGGVDSKGDFTIGGGINLSMGFHPMDHQLFLTPNSFGSSSPLVSRVFFDNNNNRTYDSGDIPIQGAMLNINNTLTESNLSNSEGIVVSNLDAFRINNVSLNEESIESQEQSYLVSSNRGRSVKKREGSLIAIDFPVYQGGDIEGFVHYTSPNRKDVLYNFPVKLIDHQGKELARVRSQFDGYFSIGNVPLGEYTLKIDEKHLELNDYKMKSEVKVSLTPDNDISGGNIIEVIKKKEK